MRFPGSRITTLLAMVLITAVAASWRSGAPAGLRADEGAFLGAALSLAHDGDVVIERTDLRRVFEETPFTGPTRLRIAVDAEAGLARWAPRDPIYAAVAALPARILGRAGIFGFGALCLAGTIAILAAHRRRNLRDATAAPLATAFVLLGGLGPLLFRVQPEPWTALLAAAVAALPVRTALGASASGLALGLAVVPSPWLGPLALLPAARLARDGRRAAFALIGLSAGLLLAFAAFRATSGGAETLWVEIDHPLVAGGAALSATELAENFRVEEPPSDGFPAPFALVLGAHAGWLPYFPMAALALVLFVLPISDRPRPRWTAVALGLSAGTILFLVGGIGLPPGTWDHLGDPRFAPLAPLFVLLLPRMRAAVLVPATWLVGAVVAGPILFTSLGSPVPDLPVHGHLGSFPWTRLPVEPQLLPRLPHWSSRELPEGRLWYPRERLRIEGDSLAVQRPGRTEVWLESTTTPADLQIEIGGSLTEPVPITVGTAGEVVAEPGDGLRRLQIGRLRPDRTTATSSWSRILFDAPEWDGPDLELRVLGSFEFLSREIYALEWLGCGAPPALEIGDEALAMARLRNLSLYPWTVTGPARVRLSYRWLDAGGQPIPDAPSLRTDLDGPVAPGAEVSAWVQLKAPRSPGSYLLELDPIFESVAWFSEKNGGITCRSSVEVRPSTAPPAS